MGMRHALGEAPLWLALPLGGLDVHRLVLAGIHS